MTTTRTDVASETTDWYQHILQGYYGNGELHIIADGDGEKIVVLDWISADNWEDISTTTRTDI